MEAKQPLALLVLASAAAARLTAQPVPQSLEEGVSIALFAAEPDIVTPVGATFDADGRLLVIESHTHKRPEGYTGPPTDRIRVVEDTDGDGRADRFTTFFEGTSATMSLATGPNGEIFVATRQRILQLLDSDRDGQADVVTQLVHLETAGDYPHNGLSGLAVHPDGYLLFGMGENLGADYVMHGRDDRRQRGSGEGGVFRLGFDGSDLERLATGFWNPFGITADPEGRIFAVGNDADSRPPCRLVQIVPTGDYGYQYRYGRSGRHPLQAWDGELPGTLPMVAGTSEAPCELRLVNGQLWTASWGDHRIERFELRRTGASFRGARRTVIQGDEFFRPVALTTAPNGDLYVTDWVDRSYPVHGKGRIWRITFGPDVRAESRPLTATEASARAAATRADWDALGSADAFVRQHAVAGLAASSDETDFATLQNPRQRLSLLQALRWRDDHSRANPKPAPIELLERALGDPSQDVALYAIRWIADANVGELSDAVSRQLTRPGSTLRFVRAALAAQSVLEGRSADVPADRILGIVRDGNTSDSVRAALLRLLDVALFTDEELERWSTRPTLQREALRIRFLRQPSRPRATADDTPRPDDIDGWLKLVGKDGNAEAGWRVFFGSGGCAACHRFDGRGGHLGPDLTAVGSGHDRRGILRSILTPNAEVAPRYAAEQLDLDDGGTMTGTHVGHSADGTRDLYATVDGRTVEVDPASVVSRTALRTSIMPTGLARTLSVAELRDLLALLAGR